MIGDDSLPVKSVNSNLHLPSQGKENWDFASLYFRKEQRVDFKTYAMLLE